MAHSITEDVFYYTPYGQTRISFDPPVNPLRYSLIAAAAAIVVSGAAIVHGIGRLPSVEALEQTTSPAELAIGDDQPRAPLEILPPDVAAQANVQPVRASAVVTAPDVAATLYATPTADETPPVAEPVPVETQAVDAEAVSEAPAEPDEAPAVDTGSN